LIEDIECDIVFTGYTYLFKRIGNTTIISIGYARIIGEFVIENLTL